MQSPTDAIEPVTGAGGFRRLVCAALVSLGLYAVLFGAVLDRPLDLGFLARQLDAGLARAAAIRGPKLVILAGSNGPYSHRCQVIEPMLDLPCVNGGVAIGIGLDYLFTRWRVQLHPGDTVYLPMEQQQYTVGRSATALGPDAAIMFRHDWTTLGQLAPRRWLAALFAFDARAGLMSVIEMSLVAVGFHDPRAEASGTRNAWGDHVGHTVARGGTSLAVLAAMLAPPARAAAIRDGYGSGLIAGFVVWARAHDVRVIGGLPTQLDPAAGAGSLAPETLVPEALVPQALSSEIPAVERLLATPQHATSPPAVFRSETSQPATAQPSVRLAAIEAVYLRHGGEFLLLANHSRYPSTAFFDTPLHLNEPCQIAHSIMLARALAPMLGQAALAPPVALSAAASACPGMAGAMSLAQGSR
jgi:hypothetical protein